METRRVSPGHGRKEGSVGMAVSAIPAISQRDENKNYKLEQTRLYSFRQWPSWAGQCPEDLAREGMYYTGTRDEVKCFSCGVLFRLWKPDDQIRERHSRYSPHCSFLRRLNGHKISGGSQSRLAANAQIEATASSSDEMQMEMRRLATFDDRWPTSCPIRPTELAQSGFYFKGKGDSVHCFSCHVILKGWTRGDTADGEHRRHNPFCPFLTGKDDSNVPIAVHTCATTPKSLAQPQTVPHANLQLEQVRLLTFNTWSSTAVPPEELAKAGFYYPGKHNVTACFHCRVQVCEWLPGDIPLDKHLSYAPRCSFANAMSQKKKSSFDDDVSLQATSQRMNQYFDRLASFKTWPKTSPVPAESLAQAGFFYTGSSDGVICFSCGGALKGWEQGDTAWGEHAKHFPSCQFVKDYVPQTTALTTSYNETWSHASAAAQSLQSRQAVSRHKETDFIQQAFDMGFRRDVAKTTLEKHRTESLTLEMYLDKLLIASSENESRTENLVIPECRSSSCHPATATATGGQILEERRSSSTGRELLQSSNRGTRKGEGIRLCRVCEKREADVLFIPCAHILSCGICAPKLTKCPVCMTEVQTRIRSYFA